MKDHLMTAFLDILLVEIRGITILDWLPCLYEIESLLGR